MTTLSNVFRVLNELESDGIIRRYAIAGAMAFLFYTEPARTYDLDVCVFLPPQEGLIISMEPLYSELAKRGYSFDAEHVMIHETPVQFLPAYNPLAEEAVDNAVEQSYEDVPVNVVGPEYLAALAFQTGGSHRLTRADALIESGALNRDMLEEIMARHSIARKRSRT